MTNHQIGIQHLKSSQILAYIRGFEFGRILDRDTDFLVLEFFYYLLEPNLLQVQDNVGHVFLYTRHRRELMLHTSDTDGVDSIAFKR